jgi:hypothetical protein
LGKLDELRNIFFYLFFVLSKPPGVASLDGTSHNKLSGESFNTFTSGIYWKYHRIFLLCSISVITVPIQKLQKRKTYSNFPEL